VTGRDFRGEAEQEARQSEAFRQWVRERVEQIHRRVSCDDVLARNGVRLRYGGHKAEQFSCPFHGKDNKPSTRFYPSEGGKPEGVWCFVCQERWDCITLYKRFEQFEGPFTRLLASMERAFGLPTPEMPREAARAGDGDALHAEVEQLFDVCERRLIGARESFTLEGYLTLGSVLDRLRHRLERGGIPSKEASRILRKVLDKIGERARGAAGQAKDP
jgi:hypothetical protein